MRTRTLRNCTRGWRRRTAPRLVREPAGGPRRRDPPSLPRALAPLHLAHASSRADRVPAGFGPRPCAPALAAAPSPLARPLGRAAAPPSLAPRSIDAESYALSRPWRAGSAASSPRRKTSRSSRGKTWATPRASPPRSAPSGTPPTPQSATTPRLPGDPPRRPPFFLPLPRARRDRFVASRPPSPRGDSFPPRLPRVASRHARALPRASHPRVAPR